MNNLENIKDLLNKEVTRREFLLHIGAALLALIGISSLLKNLSNAFDIKPSNIQSQGYGFSAYSGTTSKPPSNLPLIK